MTTSRTIANGDVTLPNGPFVWKGADGTTQFSIGATSNSAEYIEADGGISGAGASLISRNAAQTGNVPLNLTAQGNANVNFANSGSGRLAQAVDPGAAVSTNGQVQLTPSTSNGPVKVGNSTYGISLDPGGANVLLGGLPLAPAMSGYVANAWVVPFGVEGSTTAVGTNGQDTIKLFPIVIPQKVTISALAARVTTLFAGGNFQLAVYANNPATGRPTGSALVSTANISTAATGDLSASASVQLSQGIYWLACNCDNATAAFSVLNAGIFSGMSKMFGSQTSLSNAFAGQTLTGLSVSGQTFGTWPSLTSATFGDVTVNGNPVILFKVGSVP